MGLRDYLRVLRKRWRWLAVCMILGAAVAVSLTLTTTPKYQATSQLFVASGEINTTGNWRRARRSRRTGSSRTSS